MELVETVLRLFSSAAAVLAIALAYDTAKKVEKLKERIGEPAEESHEIVCGGDVRADGDERE